jgi:hypothetical protein
VRSVARRRNCPYIGYGNRAGITTIAGSTGAAGTTRTAITDSAHATAAAKPAKTGIARSARATGPADPEITGRVTAIATKAAKTCSSDTT